MSIKLQLPKLTDLKPRLVVIGVGGAGGNALNNMISAGLTGVEFVAANTDAQALAMSAADYRLQLGVALTEGLGAGSKPEVGRAAAEEAIEDIRQHLAGAHMCFIAAGMGGGTGTGATSVIARVAKDLGLLTVGVVTKPFQFEGARRLRMAEMGIAELRRHVDTLIVIPNQNLFRIANERTTFAEAFRLADQVLHSGVACVVDLIVREGLINLDFADVRTVMANMGNAMMGTGEASGEGRAITAAEAAIHNPLIDDVSLKGAKGLLLSVMGGRDLTLYEVDEAASRIRQEVDPEANIIVGATFDDSLEGRLRVSIVASGINLPGAAPYQSLNDGGQLRDRLVGALQSGVDSYAAPVAHHGSPVAQGQSLPPHAAAEPPLELGEDIAPEARPPTWKGPGDVSIVESMPQLSHAQASAAARMPEPPAETPRAGQFRPTPPVEPHLAARRVPDISAFPAIGQREFHAKRQVMSPAGPPSEAAATPTDKPARSRRPGFFARWNNSLHRRGSESPRAHGATDSPYDAGDVSPEITQPDYRAAYSSEATHPQVAAVHPQAPERSLASTNQNLRNTR